MPPKSICKSVFQYNNKPISDADMQKLLAIARDYQAVKRQVYQRYGGVSALPKLYPGYTVQREMAESSLRAELGLPAVYFNLAIFDALGDIRNSWGRTKSAVRVRISRNENFTEVEKHYLRFILKIDGAFSGILNQEPLENWSLTDAIRKRYEALVGKLSSKTQTKPDTQIKSGIQTKSETLTESETQNRLHRYLCRQVRKLHKRPKAKEANGFYSSKGTHRYGNHGIYFTTKEHRKRVFIPLTDGNAYKRQIYVTLYPETHSVTLQATIQASVRTHTDYNNDVEVTLGHSAMLVTCEGHIYGAKWKELSEQYVLYDSLNSGDLRHTGIQKIGKKKLARIHRLREHLTSYVNGELNRFLREEKPGSVYLRGTARTPSARYMQKRLVQKCREHSVVMIKIWDKKRKGHSEGGLR